MLDYYFRILNFCYLGVPAGLYSLAKLHSCGSGVGGDEGPGNPAGGAAGEPAEGGCKLQAVEVCKS